jgi:hypothetical protein
MTVTATVSPSFTPQASPSQTPSPAQTLSLTPSAQQSPSASATETTVTSAATATPEDAAGQTPGQVQDLIPALNPQSGPELQLAFYLSGRAEGLSLAIYTKAYQCIRREDFKGPWGKGWHRLGVPAVGLPNGLVYVQLQASNRDLAAGKARTCKLYRLN